MSMRQGERERGRALAKPESWHCKTILVFAWIDLPQLLFDWQIGDVTGIASVSTPSSAPSLSLALSLLHSLAVMGWGETNMR